MNIFLLYCI